MNIITIAGQLGKDAEIRYTPKGDAVASFSVADSQGKDANPIWWRCSLFGKRAESLTQYLTKGQAVTVTGSITEREYTDKDGHTKKATDVRVNDLALQGGRKESSGIAPHPASAKAQAKPSSGFDEDSDIQF
jgi:single-strand DNA-binding protein